MMSQAPDRKAWQPDLHQRWKPEWVQHVIACLSDPAKGKDAVLTLPWYTDDNGFDRTQFWAYGERLDLRGIFFQGCKFCGTDLNAVNFDECSFIDTDLSGSSLRFASMKRCQFVRANFAHTDLDLVKFQDSGAQDLDISGAKCTAANFDGFNFAIVKAYGTNFWAASFNNNRIQQLQWNDETIFFKHRSIRSQFLV